MNDTSKAGYLRIDDPDEPIYRIYPLWFLEEATRLKQLVLVEPSLWEDPWERLAEGIGITPRVNGELKPQMFLEQYLRPAYAQAWTRSGDSDTLLRAYSRVVKDPHVSRNTLPAEEGVRVRSTPRKLLETLRTWCPTDPESSCFIGSVQYAPEGSLTGTIAGLVRAKGLETLGGGRDRAELLLLKRKDYSHESEVRLIYIEERNIPNRESILRIPFEPNSVFDEIMFDPRLAVFERNEREAAARKLGYEGTITPSQRNLRRMLDVQVVMSEAQYTHVLAAHEAVVRTRRLGAT